MITISQFSTAGGLSSEQNPALQSNRATVLNIIHVWVREKRNQKEKDRGAKAACELPHRCSCLVTDDNDETSVCRLLHKIFSPLN